MFSHEKLRENRSGGDIELKELTFEAVDVVVDYLYTGVANIRGENAQDVLLASGLLQVGFVVLVIVCAVLFLWVEIFTHEKKTVVE